MTTNGTKTSGMKNLDKPLLLAVDNSQAAITLADFVGNNFNKGQHIEVLHVQNRQNYAVPNGAGAAGMAWDLEDSLNEDDELDSAKFLHDKIAPKLEAAGMIVNTVLLRQRSDGSSAIGNAICKHAEKIGAPLIIMTKLSKSALAKFFAGSVTRFCVAHAETAVLVV